MARDLAFVADDSPDAPEREFKVVTLVLFRRKIGRAYYGFIRPFHHLVIFSMCRSGSRRFAPRQ